MPTLVQRITLATTVSSVEYTYNVYSVEPIKDHYASIGISLKELDSVNEFVYASLPEGSHGRFLIRAKDAVELTQGTQIKLTIQGALETFVHNNLFITKISYHSVNPDAWALIPTNSLDNKFAIIEVADMWYHFNQTVRKDYNRITVMNPESTANTSEPTSAGLQTMQQVLDSLAATFAVSGTPTVQISGFPNVRPRNMLFAGSTTVDCFQLIADAYLLVTFIDRQTGGAGKIIFSDAQPSTVFSYAQNREICFNYGSEVLAAKLRLVMSQQGHPFSQERSTVLDAYYPTFNLEWANSTATLTPVNDPSLPNNNRFQHPNLEYAHYFPFYETGTFNTFTSDCNTILSQLATNLVKRSLRTVDIVLKDVRVVDPCMTIQKITYKMTTQGLITHLQSVPPTPINIDPMTNHVARGLEYVPPMVSGFIGTESGANVLGGSAPNTAANFWLDDAGDGAVQIPVWNNTTQQTFEGDQTFAVFNVHTRRFEKVERFDKFFRYILTSNWSGGLATASRLLMDGTVTGKTVTVRDPLGLLTSQVSGDEGYMAYCVDNKFYALGSAGSGGSTISYFILAEDANPYGRGYVYAYQGTLNTTNTNIELFLDENDDPVMFKLYWWKNVLDAPTYAKAGYSGIRATDDNGRQVFVNGPCISGCQADGAINVETIPNGTVGTSYAHNVTGTAIDETTLNVTNLPPGLTYNPSTDVISGTPTTAGEYVILVSAESDNGCLITNAKEITIAPAT